jgi:hypothetical protein
MVTFCDATPGRGRRNVAHRPLCRPQHTKPKQVLLDPETLSQLPRLPLSLFDLPPALCAPTSRVGLPAAQHPRTRNPRGWLLLETRPRCVKCRFRCKIHGPLSTLLCQSNSTARSAQSPSRTGRAKIPRALVETCSQNTCVGGYC